MSPEPARPSVAPQPLTPEVAATLRLPWTSLLSREELVEHVARHPALCWHVPGASAYLVAGPWRNRAEIVEVFETRGDRHRRALWRALLGGGEAGARSPYAVVLIDPNEYRTAAPFYRRVGVRTIEEVQVLRSGAPPVRPVERTLELVPARPRELAELERVDHAAFPFLWRNSRPEFEEYLRAPGVTVRLARSGEGSVGYVGFTRLDGWGHIDRLAVTPEAQGRGYGSQLLSWALHELHAAGARYVQLSTQATNERSHGLYARFGFARTRSGYMLYGVSPGEATGDGGTVV